MIEKNNMRLNKNNKQTAITILITMGVVAALFGGCRQHPVQQSGGSATSGQATTVTAPAPIWKPKHTPIKSVAQATGYKRIHPRVKIIPVTPQLALQSGRLTAYLGSPSKGIIGLYDGNQTDNPADNIFSIKLDNQPTAKDKVWLTYRLAGVTDNSGVACSINDRLAFGGYLVKKDTATKRQRIQLNALWLQKGDNRIQFGLAENANYGYRVSDLAIEVEQGANDMPLAVTSSHTLYNGKAYVHGFVQAEGKTTVSIDGKEVAVRDGEFETITGPVNKQQAEVKVEMNGRVYSKTLRFENDVQADASYALSESPIRINKTFEKGKINELKTPDVLLKTDDKALLTTKNISLTALRPIDLPAMDLGMTNVTADKKGFRFLPHGEHFTQTGATVALKYDRTKIPDGYTENDIRSYYFDPKTKHWVALERDTVDKTLCMVVSKTTHFTDMINGVIKTPESPQTEGFAPTMMNGIKAADPTSKIELIAPPSANNQGSANLSYPLELPPARSGISPQLVIQYNSDGGSGWLGEGWDLNVPSITVDTRWGVPRYDQNYETETYSMNGTMLATVIDDNGTDTNGAISVAHKGRLFKRFVGVNPAEGVQFHPVTENGFSRITRLDSGPDTYYWQVITKDGITYTYGSGNNSTLNGYVNTFEYESATSSNKIKVNHAAIAEWKLSSVEDQNRNYCRYYYTNTSLAIHGSKVTAQSVQLSRIEIGRKKAKSTDSDTLYQVINFVQKTPKIKQTSNARYGFLTSNGSLLLDTIRIQLKTPNNTVEQVRSYVFNYSDGAFNTKLLNSIGQCDSSGAIVASHTFGYYNNVANKYFNTEEILDTKSVKTGENSLPISTKGLPITSSGIPALGGTTSNSKSGSFYVGAEVGFKLFGLGASAGLGYNYSASSSETDSKMLMVDINGDGLPDKLYKGTNDCLCFIPNLGKDGFGASIQISGYTGDFSFTKTSSQTNGWRGNIGASVSSAANVTVDAGMDWLTSNSETNTYLSDVNSDGLIDIVSGGKVYFNSISSFNNGVAVPSFSTNSSITPRPVLNIKTPCGTADELKLSDAFTKTPTASKALSLGKVTLSDNPIKRDSVKMLNEKVAEYEQKPMQDIVRFWEAPRSGNVTISSEIKYLGNVNPDFETDGVRFAIQTKGEEIWTDSIKPTYINGELTYGRVEISDNNTNITVTEGQRIYFRLQSGSSMFSDNLEDAVLWQQKVLYVNRYPGPYDQDGYPDETYNSSDASFVSQQCDNVVDSISQSYPWISVDGSFSKPQTRDSVQLKLYVSTDSILSRDSIAMNISIDALTRVSDTSYVKYKIWYPNEEYEPRRLVWQTTFGKESVAVNNLTVDQSWSDVTCSRNFRFEISSNTNLEWNKIKWRPELRYRREGPPSSDGSDTSRDTVIYAGVKYNIFERKYHSGEGGSHIIEGNCDPFGMNCQPYTNEHITPDIEINSTRMVNTNYTLVLLNKWNNLRVAQFTGRIINNKSTTANFVVNTLQPGEYYFSVYINDTISPDNVTASCHFKEDESSTVFTPYIYCDQQVSRTTFGHMWRGWGLFQYNAGNGRYAKPILEDSLYLPDDVSNQGMANKWGIKNMRMFSMTHKPYKESYYWTGTGDNLLVMGDTICTGRLNEADIPSILTPVSTLATGSSPSRVTRAARVAAAAPTFEEKMYSISTAPSLSSKSASTTSWGGATANIGVVNLGGNYSWSNGTNEITSAFMDMNGDGFPDYITDTRLEYTNPNGGRDGEVLTINSGEGENSSSNGNSFGFGGGYGASFSIGAANKTGDATTQAPSQNGESQVSLNLCKDMNASIGANYSHSTNNTVATTSYIDLNGDGLPDRVYIAENKVWVCLNLGYGFADRVDWGLNQISLTRSVSNAVGGSGGVSTAANGLGMITDNSGKKILGWMKKLNIGVNLGVNYVTTNSYSLFSFFDLNMDGLPDKIYKSSNDVAVEFNTGNGFTQAYTMSEIEEFNKSASSSIGANLSVNFSIRIFWIFKITLGATGNLGWATDYTLNQMMDMDGDGYPDVLKANTGNLAELKMKRSLIGCIDKLKTITNPIGGVIRLEYFRTQPSYDHPGGKWVMNTVSINDGVTDDGDSLKNKFTYTGGKYDRYEREFLGFSDVLTENINTSSSTQTTYRNARQTFDNANYYTRGALLSSVVSGVDGTVEKKYAGTDNTYNTYLVSRIADSRDTLKWGKYALTSTQPSVTLTKDNMFLHQYIVYSPQKYSKNTTYTYSGGTQSSLVTAESYSEYNTGIGTHGELTLYKFSDKGNLGEDGTATDYNYRTNISYLNKFGMTLFALPTAVTVTGSDGKVYRHTEAIWNDNFANQVRFIKNVAAPRDTLLTSIGYDKLGNISQMELPGTKTQAKDDRMWYTYKYDNYYHLFLTEVSDHFGYTSTLSDYNYKYGTACKHTDINGNVTTSKLDNLGRVISVTGPNELAAGRSYTLQFEYHPEVKNGSGKPMPYAVTKHYDPANSSGSTINNIETVTFVDGMGRAIQVKKSGIIGTTPVMIVSGRAQYDAFGRVKAAYYPIAETDNSLKYVFNAAFDSTASHIPSSRTAYDVLDRVLLTKLPDGTSTSMSYAIDTIKGINYMKTTVTDALNHSQITYANGSGKTIQTVQRPDSAAIITKFAYDPIDQLTTVTDAKGKQTVSVYDQLGRRTQVTHPASGVTKFEYDQGGNLSAKQTANMIASGKKIRYFYTYNRLDSIVYPDHPENNVKYVYGGYDHDNKDGFNLKGHLKSLEDGSGKQEFKYGLQGEVTEVKRTLVIPNQAVATYTTSTVYDSWNRLMSMTYPDGEVVNYAYNTAGLLTGVVSSANTYVSNITYDKFEQRASMQYGNGAITNYTYNPLSRRMDNLNVKVGANYIMNNAYTYDAVSNVKSVTNTGTASNNMGGAMVHNYNYDNLYRLKSANGTFTGANGKAANYTLGMGYDDMHNITSKSQNITQNNVQFTGALNAGYNLSYTYNANNSQQISNIADDSYRYASGESQAHTVKTQNFSYDANGNLTCINTGTQATGGKLLVTNSRKLLWDEENRLLSVSDNGFVSNYWYDASGERTVKESGDNEGVSVNGVLSGARTGSTNFTAYISPYLVVNNGGNYTKHIYMGGQRITSKVGNFFTSSNTPVTTTVLQDKYTAQTTKIKERFDSLGVTYKGTPQSGGLVSSNPATTSSYFYHSDHLGSSSLITDASGDIVQHLEYVPFGETFIDERRSASSWTTPYQFSGKERDEETGLLYFGARYQDSKYGIWYSVDPLAEKYPNISSYVYCADNPVKFIDPNGKEIFFFIERFNAVTRNTEFQPVSFSQLDNKSKEIFYADLFRTDGKNFLQNFITEKQTFTSSNRSVTIEGNGTNFDAYYYFDSGTSEIDENNNSYHVNGSTSWDINKNSVIMKVHVDVVNEDIYQATYTYGHEEELHEKDELNIIKRNFINGSNSNADIKNKFNSAHESHEAYAKNKGGSAKGFKSFLNYMKLWFGEKQMNKVINQGDKENKQNVNDGK